ncbi:HAD domain-containing protein [Nocardiopsis tropica]|uniref:hypothetical protein n=1 Tax=Nocardiopsis tropica TaxID=109330 RepID=UPI0031D660E9
MQRRPLLFVDIDGPLNPYDRGNRSARRAGYVRHSIEGFTVKLKRAHGAALLALPFELVWATTWRDDANTLIGPRIGLPRLPVCEFPSGDEGAPEPVHFKTPGIVGYAAGRAFAWIDDEVTGADRAWVAERHGGPALLHRVDPAAGLRAADFGALAAWAEDPVPPAP